MSVKIPDFEAAARLHCEIMGVDPDDETQTLRSKGDGYMRLSLRWEVVADDLRKRYAMERAMGYLLSATDDARRADARIQQGGLSPSNPPTCSGS